MLNTTFRSSWLIGGWIAAMALLVAGSTAMGATLVTTALFVALGVAPGIVIALLAYSQPSPSVTHILHSVETKDGG